MPIDRTISIQSERTPHHHTLIITSRTFLKKDTIQKWFNMPDEQWHFILEQLNSQSEMQLYFEEESSHTPVTETPF